MHSKVQCTRRGRSSIWQLYGHRPNCAIPGDTDSAHHTIFIRRLLEAELSRCPSLAYDTGEVDVAEKTLATIVESNLGTNTDACHDTAVVAALIRRILQDGIGESRDTSIRGYGDGRDALWTGDGARQAQVPDGLRNAAAKGNGKDDDNSYGGAAGSGGGGGGDDRGGDDSNDKDNEDDDDENTVMMKEEAPLPTIVDRDVVSAFRGFAQEQRAQAGKRRLSKVIKDKDAKIKGFKAFSSSFQLQTPMPLDIAQILKKGPFKPSSTRRVPAWRFEADLSTESAPLLDAVQTSWDVLQAALKKHRQALREAGIEVQDTPRMSIDAPGTVQPGQSSPAFKNPTADDLALLAAKIKPRLAVQKATNGSTSRSPLLSDLKRTDDRQDNPEQKQDSHSTIGKRQGETEESVSINKQEKKRLKRQRHRKNRTEARRLIREQQTAEALK